MVGNSAGIKAMLFQVGNQLLDMAHTIKQGVFCMQMQMRKYSHN